MNGRFGIPFWYESQPHIYCCRGRLERITDMGSGGENRGEMGKSDEDGKLRASRLPEMAFPADEGQDARRKIKLIREVKCVNQKLCKPIDLKCMFIPVTIIKSKKLLNYSLHGLTTLELIKYLYSEPKIGSLYVYYNKF